MKKKISSEKSVTALPITQKQFPDIEVFFSHLKNIYLRSLFLGVFDV